MKNLVKNILYGLLIILLNGCHNKKSESSLQLLIMEDFKNSIYEIKMANHELDNKITIEFVTNRMLNESELILNIERAYELDYELIRSISYSVAINVEEGIGLRKIYDEIIVKKWDNVKGSKAFKKYWTTTFIDKLVQEFQYLEMEEQEQAIILIFKNVVYLEQQYLIDTYTKIN